MRRTRPEPEGPYHPTQMFGGWEGGGNTIDFGSRLSTLHHHQLLDGLFTENLKIFAIRE
jgi:hypothetical protein